VLQTPDCITATLTETRNRVDLIIIAGSDVFKLHPRFYETIVSPPDSMFEVTAPERTLVFVGKGLAGGGATASRIGDVIPLACKLEQAGEVVGVLRARLRG